MLVSFTENNKVLQVSNQVIKVEASSIVLYFQESIKQKLLAIKHIEARLKSNSAAKSSSSNMGLACHRPIYTAGRYSVNRVHFKSHLPDWNEEINL